MKALMICCLMVLSCLFLKAQPQKIDLQGAWKLVCWQNIENGKILNVFPGNATIDQTNIWSGNTTMVVRRFKSETEDSYAYSVGTWKLKSDLYEERNSITSCNCVLVKMKLEMRNDTLVQTFPLNEKYEMDNKTHIIAKFLRIK